MKQEKVKSKFDSIISILSNVGGVAAAASVSIAFLTAEVSDKLDNKIPFIAAMLTAIIAAITALLSSKLRLKSLRKKSIFISYSHRDLETVRQIVSGLQERGFNPWLDVDEIVPGQKWTSAIDKAIAESSAALLIISENFYAESNRLEHENSIILNRLDNKELSSISAIPVYLDNSPPPQELRDVQGVLYKGSESIDKLEKGLQRILESV